MCGADRAGLVPGVQLYRCDHEASLALGELAWAVSGLHSFSGVSAAGATPAGPPGDWTLLACILCSRLALYLLSCGRNFLSNISFFRSIHSLGLFSSSSSFFRGLLSSSNLFSCQYRIVTCFCFKARGSTALLSLLPCWRGAVFFRSQPMMYEWCARK